jgi:methyl-accepting chemotaxis protein
MILKIQDVSKSTVEGIASGAELIKEGIKSAEESGSKLEQIISGTKKTLATTNLVASANLHETHAVNQIGENISDINNITLNSVDAVLHVKNSVEELKRLTSNLQDSFGAFKIGTEFNNLTEKLRVHI